MKVTIKQWIPNGGKFERYYVSNESGEQIGFIQLDLQNKGYGSGYYANHRASKGDSGVETVSNIKIEGNEVVLNGVIELAKSRHSELDIALAQMSLNVNTMKFGLKVKTKVKAKADYTFEISEAK